MIFVILNHPNEGVISPLMDEEGESVAVFDSIDDALAAIPNTTLGRHYGGKVFDTDEPIREA